MNWPATTGQASPAGRDVEQVWRLERAADGVRNTESFGMGSVVSHPSADVSLKVAPIRCHLGADVPAASRGHGLEGVVAKRLDSRYHPGIRSPAWREDQERAPPGRGHRRLETRRGRPQQADRLPAHRRVRQDRWPGVHRASRHRGSPATPSPRSASCSRHCAATPPTSPGRSRQRIPQRRLGTAAAGILWLSRPFQFRPKLAGRRSLPLRRGDRRSLAARYGTRSGGVCDPAWLRPGSRGKRTGACAPAHRSRPASRCPTSRSPTGERPGSRFPIAAGMPSREGPAEGKSPPGAPRPGCSPCLRIPVSPHAPRTGP